MDLKELAKFLVKAKKNTYAAGAKADGDGILRIWRYSEGDYNYEDIFTSEYEDDLEFSGQELVEYKRKLVWVMGYNGGMIEQSSTKSFIDDTYIFLKAVLKLVEEDTPFRGPSRLTIGDFDYLCCIDGDISNFTGKEQIYKKGKQVYEVEFNGGLVGKNNENTTPKL